MDVGGLYRMATPPAPETPRLRRFRLAVAGLLLALAIMIVFQQPVLALWRPLILLYPLATAAALVLAILFFRAKARWNETWWTDERRAEHYARVAAGLPSPASEESRPCAALRRRRPF
jgi:hypothetical protein